VVRLADGSFRLFYVAGKSIGEATSSDGVVWQRAPNNPVFAPSQPVDPATLPPGVKLPFVDDAVDDPSADIVTTAGERTLIRMLYTGRDRRGGVTIGYAGRIEGQAKFDRAPGSVFGSRVHANAPAILRFENFSLLFANIDLNPGRNPEQAIGVAATYVQATPDLMMGDLLKNMRSSQIFSVCGLPEIKLTKHSPEKRGEPEKYTVELIGLDTFDPATMEVGSQAGRGRPGVVPGLGLQQPVLSRVAGVLSTDWGLGSPS
jgi:hypothetical protein